MNVRLLASLTLACLAACGCCRSSRLDLYIDAMNAERRALEDQIYDLEYQYEMTAEELAACRRENEKLRDEPGRPPAREEKEPEAEFDQLAPPFIDPGVEGPPSLKLDGAGDAPPRPEGETTDENNEKDKTAQPADARVTHIVLNPRYTGGWALDEDSGYEGLSVLVEPRNAAGQYVPQAGALSIAVLDPAKEGEEARVAAWRLDPSETERCLRRSPSERGIRWQAPWPNGLPEHGKLDLFVRFETTDGRTLEPVHQEIFVALPGQFSQRWTPRRAERAARRVQTALDGGPSQPLDGPLAPLHPGQSDVQALQPRPTWRPYR